ncbi:copper chaperone PCu(A)C [Lacibacterium aquatile]|uniref:Copper chaperone PCu(A)C n=1 Tax=Lacibacterium aquatile TaxID=1168082 RepID=A0ABW5DSB1_9PROT
MKPTILIAALATLLAGAAQAHEFKAGEIRIDHPWARATPPRITTGAAYMTFENKGMIEDRLVSATSPASSEVQFHENKDEGGIMQMRQIQSLVIPVGTTIAMKPSTMHLMLVRLKEPLKIGTKVPLTLVFEKAGPVMVELAVDKPGATGPKTEDHSGH